MMGSNILSIDDAFDGSLGSVLDRLRRFDNKVLEKLGDPVDILFLRNFTIEGIEPFVKYHFYHSGLNISLSFGGYDTIAQDVMASDLDLKKSDMIVLSLLLDPLEPDFEISKWSAGDVSDRILGLIDQIGSRTQAMLIVNTFIRPVFSDTGVVGENSALSVIYKIEHLNRTLKEYAVNTAHSVFVIDWERIVMQFGMSASIDRRFAYLSRAPFTSAFLNAYAGEIAKLGRALRGKSKKCLVLDCDNTLWGGVLGEEGLHGVKLDRNEYPGKAYYDFQKSVIKLYERGVLVAICSKNNETDVWELIEKHPHCLIKRHHISAFQINWDNKAENIVKLADELKLGLDSFVLLDDSEFECEMVRKLIPDVTVIRVPDRLHAYPDILFESGLFDSIHIGDEDRRRTEMYLQESARQKQRLRFENIDAYLASLKLQATVHPIRRKEIGRVAQLTQKTNQFNLTTRRYAESQIMAFAEDPGKRVFSLTVRDRFGDSGLTGVLIAVRDENRVHIDLLLMSCRILGRKLEQVFVQTGLQTIDRQWHPEIWMAEYIPTAKNRQVETFWETFGFVPLAFPDGKKTYQAESGRLTYPTIPYIEVISD